MRSETVYADAEVEGRSGRERSKLDNRSIWERILGVRCNDGRPGRFDFGRESNSNPRMGGGRSRLAGTHHHRGHRKRRFHVAREALGRGYRNYDVTGPKCEAAEPKTEVLEPEALSEDEIARRTSWRGIRICAALLAIIFIGLQSNFFSAAYLALARAWNEFSSVFLGQ